MAYESGLGRGASGGVAAPDLLSPWVKGHPLLELQNAGGRRGMCEVFGFPHCPHCAPPKPLQESLDLNKNFVL